MDAQKLDSDVRACLTQLQHARFILNKKTVNLQEILSCWIPNVVNSQDEILVLLKKVENEGYVNIRNGFYCLTDKGKEAALPLLCSSSEPLLATNLRYIRKAHYLTRRALGTAAPGKYVR